MNTKIEERLARITQLVAEREKIDRELEEILGLNGDKVGTLWKAPFKGNSKIGGKKPYEKGKKGCSICGKVGHNKKTCPSAGSNDGLDGDQKLRIKELRKEGQTNEEIATDMGLPISIVEEV